jgi:hypothetical protein
MNLVDFEDLPMILPSVQYHQHIKLQKASGIKQNLLFFMMIASQTFPRVTMVYVKGKCIPLSFCRVHE